MAKILVVDDEPANVALLDAFLSGKGYQTLTAFNGEEALQRVKEERPQVVLLDIQMPGMNGLEVLQRIREIDREVGVIMVTGLHEEQIGQQALHLGAFDYVTKPVDFRYLENVVWYKVAELTV